MKITVFLGHTCIASLFAATGQKREKKKEWFNPKTDVFDFSLKNLSSRKSIQVAFNKYIWVLFNRLRKKSLKALPNRISESRKTK